MPAAYPAAGVIVVSIFVNPLQFGPNEDLARYPRDRSKPTSPPAGDEGADLVFTPGVADMYPEGADDDRHPGPAGRRPRGRGAARALPGRADRRGQAVPPRRARTSRSSARRTTSSSPWSRRWCATWTSRVDVVGVPTVREADGLALSSPQRLPLARAARRRSCCPGRCGPAAGCPPRGAEAVLATARRCSTTSPSVAVDYLDLRAPDLGPAPPVGPARLLVAARVGTTRLIDNIAVRL